MSKEKLNRNLEIVGLINLGISYRNIARLLNITCSAVERINRHYNKDKARFCVRCGSYGNLLLDNKVLNVCKTCIKDIKSAC